MKKSSLGKILLPAFFYSVRNTHPTIPCVNPELFFLLTIVFWSMKICRKTFSYLPPPLFCSLFPGRKTSVSPDVVETLKKQAEYLRMPSPIMMDPNNGESFSTFLNILCHYYVIKAVCLFFICILCIHRNLPSQPPALRGAQCPQQLIRKQDGTSSCESPGCSFWCVCELVV